MQQALESCHIELETQRDKMRVQRSECESLLRRLNQPRDSSINGKLSDGRHTGAASSPTEVSEPMGQTQSDCVTRMPATPTKERSGKCFVCGERDYFARLFCSLSQVIGK